MTSSSSSASASKRRPKKKSLIDALTSGEYKFDESMSRPKRVAHLLDWAATHFPKEYCPWPYVVKATQGYRHTPRAESQEVVAMRRCASSVRILLFRDYQRLMDVQSGIGIRALVDSTDNLQVDAPKQARRMRTARDGVIRTMTLIDLDSVPNTPELKALKSWAEKDFMGIFRTISAAEFERRLLPPGVGSSSDGSSSSSKK